MSVSAALRAVFLSYASQDTAAVAALAAALRAEGIEVWVDQDELRGGEAWDAKIKKQIRECALFVPVISENTQARPEGYFRLEWHLAEQRSLLIARGRPFVVPVCLDATTEGDALVPEAFLAVQWTRLSSGRNPLAFVAQVKRLLAGGATPVGSGSVAPAGKSGVHPDTPVIPDYELLRRIGQGAYGDVWLARGLTGVYRAIKIVWRDRFDDPAPYHREFRGVKEAMAISLEAGQLPLLHIGQDEKAGYFYYVMELADDVKSGRTIDPERYVPLTLKELKARHGRLPAAQCLAFAEELAQALAALHARGLVHRDIKPSNVVIVHGQPKLADIGLLASANDAQTYVGTQGYLAPEGPGSPAADVFALGRLLYELATGFDREEFPRMPADVTDRAERTALFAFNEVLLRAGEPRAEQRYRDGAALLADLRARRERMNRRRARGRMTLALAGVAAILTAALVLRPREVPSALPVALPSPALAPAPPGKSIAVLPFENLSGEKADDYIAIGIHEDVETNLASIRALRVNSTAHYRGTNKTMREVGTELRVAFVLTGSLRREGNQVRLTTRLIDARTGTQLWARHFDREVKDVLKLQGDLADEIVPALQVVLTPDEKATLARAPTTNAAAYALYLQARQWFEGKSPDSEEGIEQKLRQAVALDPGFVRAWVALAAVHRLRYAQFKSDPTEARLVMAEQAIAEASRLAPDDPEVIMGQGEMRYYCYNDYDGALALFRRVLTTHPNYPKAHEYSAYVYRRQGRWAETLAEFRVSWNCAPADPQAARCLLKELMRARRLKEAGEFLRDMQRYWPDDPDVAFESAKASFEVTGGSDADLEQWFARLPEKERDTDATVDRRMDWAICSGNEPMMLELMRSGRFTKDLDVDSLLLFRNEQDLLQKSLDEAKPDLDDRLRHQPQFWATWKDLAKYYALRGNRTEALAAISRARQLLPEASDAANGVNLSNEIATVLVWLGDTDAAISEIERLIKIPNGLHVIDLQHYVPLKPVREDPRIRALIADPKNNAPLF